MKRIMMIVSIFLTAAMLFSWTGFSEGAKKKTTKAKSFKADKRKPFVGSTEALLETSCLPDKCQALCKMSCDGIAREECAWSFDNYQACVTNHPPQNPTPDAAAMHGEMASCVENNPKEFEKPRCTYYTSELDHRLYTSADPAGKCRELFGEYQGCVKKHEIKEGDDTLALTIEALQSCQSRFNAEFENNKCALVTEKNVRRLYGRNTTEGIVCFIDCK